MEVCRVCNNKFKDYQNKCRARCGSCNTKIRRFRTKLAAIKYLGGKCKDCGWAGDEAALQFHYKDPTKKDFIIGNVANRNWELIQHELDKCILLCANCHAIRHSTKNNKKFMQEALHYKGRKLNI